jgi:hypothetical protein
MLRALAWSLGIGIVGGALVAGLKSAGLMSLPTGYLYEFYEQNPVFTSARGKGEFLVLQFVLIFFLTAAIAWAMLEIPVHARRIGILLAAVVLVFCLSPVLALYGTKVEPFSWILAVLCGAFPCIFLFNSAQTLRKRRMGAILDGKATAALIARASSEPSTVFDGSEDREISVVVCSLLAPDEVSDDYFERSKAFLGAVREFLLSSGGCLDEPAPDFVRAWFGVPVTTDGHARDACESALLLERHLAKTLEPARSVGFGIAVDSGMCAVGFRKVRRREILNVSGPVLELTRESSLSNRDYGSKIIIGARALRLAEKTIEVRPLELIKSRDTGSLFEIYELIGLAGSLSEAERARRDAYWEGVICLRSGRNEEALARFEVATDQESEQPDPVLDYFITAAQNGRINEPTAS